MARYKKLKDAMAAAGPAPDHEAEITDGQAQFLAEVGGSQASCNDVARLALAAYLEDVLVCKSISDAQGRAALKIMSAATTSNHKALCDKIICRYVAQFPVESKEPVPA